HARRRVRRRGAADRRALRRRARRRDPHAPRLRRRGPLPASRVRRARGRRPREDAHADVTAPEESVARFTMMSEPDQLARMRSWLWTQLVGHALSLEACSAVLVAVGEICNNVIKHAYAGAAGQPIAIALRALPDRVTIDVEDEGVPYDPRGYTPPDLDAVPERGMGLFL